MVGKSGEPGTSVTEMSHSSIFAWPFVFSDRPPVLWWLFHGEGWDAVGINCKKGAGVKYMG